MLLADYTQSVPPKLCGEGDTADKIAEAAGAILSEEPAVPAGVLSPNTVAHVD